MKNILTILSFSSFGGFLLSGIRNSVLKNFTPFPQRDDTGALFENYMVSERMKKNFYSHSTAFSYFWRISDGMEVDYLETDSDKISAFEFKLTLTRREGLRWQSAMEETAL